MKNRRKSTCQCQRTQLMLMEKYTCKVLSNAMTIHVRSKENQVRRDTVCVAIKTDDERLPVLKEICPNLVFHRVAVDVIHSCQIQERSGGSSKITIMRPPVLKHKNGLKCILRCRISRLTSQHKNAAHQLTFPGHKLHDSILTNLLSQ